MSQSIEDGLVERLRKPDCWTAHFHDEGAFETWEEAAPFQAADTITRLKEALTEARHYIAWQSSGFSASKSNEMVTKIDTTLSSLKGTRDHA